MTTFIHMVVQQSWVIMTETTWFAKSMSKSKGRYMCIYIYMTDSSCCIAETNITLYTFVLFIILWRIFPNSLKSEPFSFTTTGCWHLWLNSLVALEFFWTSCRKLEKRSLSKIKLFIHKTITFLWQEIKQISNAYEWIVENNI